jgi:serine/threonine protein kinase
MGPGTAPAAGAPSRLGRYQIVGEIGRGGMGIVYRALDPTIGRTVAIKTILVSGQGSEELALARRYAAIFEKGQAESACYVGMTGFDLQIRQNEAVTKGMRLHYISHSDGRFSAVWRK